MKKNIWTLAVLLWMCLIFWFSAKPADESADMSQSVGHLAGELFVRDFQEWKPQEQDAFAERIDHFVRKSAHAAEYVVLGFLLGGHVRLLGSAGKETFFCDSGQWNSLCGYGRVPSAFCPGTQRPAVGCAAGQLWSSGRDSSLHRRCVACQVLEKQKKITRCFPVFYKKTVDIIVYSYIIYC